MAPDSGPAAYGNDDGHQGDQSHHRNDPGGDRLVFPYIFNIADCLLVCGVAILLVRSFFLPEKVDEKKPASSESTAAQVDPARASGM